MCHIGMTANICCCVAPWPATIQRLHPLPPRTLLSALTHCHCCCCCCCYQGSPGRASGGGDGDDGQGKGEDNEDDKEEEEGQAMHLGEEAANTVNSGCTLRRGGVGDSITTCLHEATADVPKGFESLSCIVRSAGGLKHPLSTLLTCIPVAGHCCCVLSSLLVPLRLYPSSSKPWSAAERLVFCTTIYRKLPHREPIAKGTVWGGLTSDTHCDCCCF